MPQPGVHLLLADRILTHWRAHPARAPFDPNAEGVEDFLCYGALAPDYGYFPGAPDDRLSRMVHESRSGDFVRALAARAGDDRQAAFAWGVVSHVLADAAVHPLVNAAAQQVVLREGGWPNGSHSQAAHIRVELGLDAAFLRQAPTAFLERGLTAVFRDEDATFVVDAVRAVYHFEQDRDTLHAMHRAVARLAGPCLHLARAVEADPNTTTHLRDRAAELPFPHLRRVARSLLGRTSHVAAWLHPVRPRSELVERVEAALEGVTASLFAHAGSGLRRLPNFDLEMGGLAVPHALPPETAA